jgi:hypothetical protein
MPVFATELWQADRCHLLIRPLPLQLARQTRAVLGRVRDPERLQGELKIKALDSPYLEIITDFFLEKGGGEEMKFQLIYYGRGLSY